MANKLYDESKIQAIADAIRSKTGSSDTFTVGDMPDAIDGIVTGGGFALIDTISVEDVRAVKVNSDSDWFDDYNIVIIVPDLTLKSTDWIYMPFDATTAGSYTAKAKSFKGLPLVVLTKVSTAIQGAVYFRSDLNPVSDRSVGYMYYYAYDTANTMTGTFKIYGGNI